MHPAPRHAIDSSAADPQSAGNPIGGAREPARADSASGTWRLVPATGDVVCDAVARRIFGDAPDGSVASPAALLEQVDAQDRQAVALRLELCASTGVAMDCTCRLRSWQGASRRVRITAVLDRSGEERSGEGPVVSGTVQLIGTARHDPAIDGNDEALRASEARLATVFNQTIVGILHRDLDGNVLMVNDRYLEIVGRSAETLSGLAMAAFTHPDDLAWNAPLYERHLETGEPFTAEKRYVRPDGSVVWCEIHVSFVPDATGATTSTITVAHDITARKDAERQQQQANDMLQLSLDSAGAGTWAVDLATGLLSMSPGSRRIYGLPDDHSGAMSHEEWLTYVEPASAAAMTESLTAFISSPEPHFTECEIRRPDGEKRWLRIAGRAQLSEAGQPIRIVGLVYDETVRKRAEDEVRESMAKLNLVQEAALIGSFVTDSHGRTMGSRQFYRNLGFPDDTPYLSGEVRLTTIHPADRERVWQEITAATQAEDSLETEYRIVRQDDGEVRWVFARIKFERDAEGRLAHMLGAHLDITKAKRAADALRKSETLNRSFINASADCIILLGMDGTLEFMNSWGLAALKVRDKQLIYGRKWVELWPPKERAKIEVALALARSGEVGRFTAGCPTFDGERKWWDVVVTALPDEDGHGGQLLSISRDITEHRNNAERIHWTASHDALTELPNRRYFGERLERTLRQAEAAGRRIGLLILDVDDFKQVNDGLGHDAGDSLLTTIARRLRPVVRRGDLIARVGGDEFAILVSRLTSADELRETCGTVLACLKEPFVHQGCVFDCRVSIGAALYPDHGKSAKALLKSADTALYAAKKEGRARALTFAPEMRSELDRRTAMINLAREALARDDIVPHYQPKICLQTGTVKGFEALLRWRDTGGAIQLPAAIAAAFDDREISQALSERMQDRVIADMRRWLDEGLAFGGVAINAAAAEFRRNDFAERLLAKLGATDVPARYLELEVTETVFLGRGADHVERALGLLSAAGIRIALDDFGTGYASLSHLKKFPVDVIKIDQSFVRDLEFDENDAAIVRALLSLGSNLGIETVAEGIENPRQADFLMRHGCGLGQGYLFSKAIAAAEIPAMLLNGQWVVQK